MVKAELVCPSSIFARSSGKRCARALTQRGQSLTRALQVHARDAVYLSVITVWGREILPEETYRRTPKSAQFGYNETRAKGVKLYWFTDMQLSEGHTGLLHFGSFSCWQSEWDVWKMWGGICSAGTLKHTHLCTRCFTCCLMSYERVPGGTWTCRSVHERFSRRYNVAIIRSCVETNNLFSSIIAETVKLIYGNEFWRLRSDECTSRSVFEYLSFFSLHSYWH